MTNYRGLVFAKLEEGGPTFEQYFAPVRKYVDWWLNRSPSGTISVLPAAHKYLLSRGIHREKVNGDGETVGDSTDEVPVRSMYREWKRLMAV